jgi:hypothetical protein
MDEARRIDGEPDERAALVGYLRTVGEERVAEVDAPVAGPQAVDVDHPEPALPRRVPDPNVEVLAAPEVRLPAPVIDLRTDGAGSADHQDYRPVLTGDTAYCYSCGRFTGHDLVAPASGKRSSNRPTYRSRCDGCGHLSTPPAGEVIRAEEARLARARTRGRARRS